jgi:hypothetical protein
MCMKLQWNFFQKNKFEGLPKLKWYVEINIFLTKKLEKMSYFILSFYFITCYLKKKKEKRKINLHNVKSNS